MASIGPSSVLGGHVILAEPSNQTEMCSDGCWGQRIPLFVRSWAIVPCDVESGAREEGGAGEEEGTIPEDHLKPGSACAGCGCSQHCCPGTLVTGGHDALLKSSFYFVHLYNAVVELYDDFLMLSVLKFYVLDGHGYLHHNFIFTRIYVSWNLE